MNKSPILKLDNIYSSYGNVQVLNDCCELNNVPSNYDLEFGDSGSISQDFKLYSNTGFCGPYKS